MRSTHAIVSLLVGASFAATTRAQELRIRPALARGQQLWFVEKTRQQIDITTPDAPTRKSLEIARTLMVEVNEVTDEGMELLLVIARVHGQVGMPVGPPRSFDTLDEALQRDPAQLAGVGAAVRSRIAEANKMLIVRTDARGRVTEDLEPAPQVERQEPLTEAQQARLRRLVTSLFGRATDAPVSQGSTWDHETRSTDPQLPTVQRAEVTLSKVDDELLTLRIAGTVATDPALATPQTIRVDGAIEGIQRLGRDGVLRASMLRAEAALRLPAMEQVPASMRLESSLRRASRQDLARLRSRVKSSLDRAEQEARRAKSEADVRVLAGAVRMYYAKQGKLPADLDALVGAELAEVPLDAWGNPYELVTGSEPQSFYVRTHGPDGEPGTDDDITSKQGR